MGGIYLTTNPDERQEAIHPTGKTLAFLHRKCKVNTVRKRHVGARSLKGLLVKMLSVVVLTTVSFMASLLVIPAAGVASATTTPTCVSKQLMVSVGKATNSSAASNVAQYRLPITITNQGGACSIGGRPKITPTGIGTLHAIVKSATLNSKKYKTLKLKRGQAAYTYLAFEYPLNSKNWNKICAPAKATGFTITIVPSHNLLNRPVKAALSEICTTGKTNDLSTESLKATPL